jgi:hypothetical protein
VHVPRHVPALNTIAGVLLNRATGEGITRGAFSLVPRRRDVACVGYRLLPQGRAWSAVSG